MLCSSDLRVSFGVEVIALYLSRDWISYIFEALWFSSPPSTDSFIQRWLYSRKYNDTAVIGRLNSCFYGVSRNSNADERS